MEEWQRNHIKNNLPDLLRLTVCNELFLAELRKNDILGEVDLDTIKGDNTQYGKAGLLYEKLDTKANGYFGLVDALHCTLQTGALKILLLPVPIGDLKVRFLGKVSTIKSLLDDSQIESLQKWLQANISSQKCIATLKNTFSNRKSALELVYDTIPKRYYLYFPRLLFRHVEISPKIFEKTCLDVFVFKNAKRSQLRKFIKFYAIESSASELLKGSITARFILLDIENDWQRICNVTKAPTHLIKYEDLSESFSVEATHGVSDALCKYLKIQNDCNIKNMSEDKFVETLLAENVRGVCICDSPGMGKSLLLANLASKFSVRCPDTIVIYFPLRNFKLPETPDAESPLSTILSNISASEMAKRILQELAKTNALKFELFLDGLDELGEKQQEYCTVFLQNILTNLPSARVFVSSRLVVRAKLEKSLGVIAYNIVPFNKETQVCFLSSFWEKKEPDSNTSKLKEFAEFCIEEIKDLLNKNENIITGVPLQCWLIATIYSRQATSYADPTREVSMTFPESILNTFSEVYSEFLIGQLGKSDCNFECMTKADPTEIQCNIHCQVKSFHAWQALQLIFPDIANQLALHVTNFDYLCLTDILSPGVLEESYLHQYKFEFLHRSFAEYLVAEFLAQTIFTNSGAAKFSKTGHWVTIEQMVYDNIFVVEKLGLYQSSLKDYCWTPLREAIVAYFLNNLLQNQTEDCWCSCRISPLNFTILSTLEGCLVNDLQNLLNILLKSAEHSIICKAIPSLGCLYSGYDTVYHAKVKNIFCAAVEFCSADSIQMLCRFFRNFDSTDLEVLKYVLSDPMRIAIRRAKYEVVLHILEMISLENMGFLYCCVEYTADLDDEEIDKRLDVAKLLLEKCPGLITESWKYDDNSVCKSPLLAKEIHLKAIKLLTNHGAEVRVMNDTGRTVFHQAFEYMLDEDLLSLADFLFLNCNARKFFLDPVITKTYLCSENFANPLILRRLPILTKMSQLESKQEEIFRDSIKSASESMENAVDVVVGLLRPEYCEENENMFKNIFLTAVDNEDINMAVLLIDFNSSIIDVRDEMERTALLRAASNGAVEMFRFLVCRGANIFAVDKNGFTVLHLAVVTHSAETFHQLISIVSEQCLKISLSELGLNNVIDEVHAHKEKAPVSVGELFNWPCNESLETPINCAVLNIRNMQLETLDLFFASAGMKSHSNESSININFADSQGGTPLHYALVFRERLEFVKYLVNHGADWSVKFFDATVLQMCANMGLIDHLKYFVGLGCDINEVSGPQSDTALLRSIQSRQNIETVRQIISLGAGKLCTNKFGAGALHYTAETGLLDHTKYFIELGFDVNQVDDVGTTPLVYAIIGGQHLEFLKQLVALGADGSIKNNDGVNVMHICAKEGLLEQLNYFMEVGYDVNATDDQGNTPLFRAVMNKQNLDFVQKMVELGADWTKTNKVGGNITHMCARRGLLQHVRYFVELECKSNSMNSNVKMIKKHNPLLSVDLEDDTILHYAIFSKICACFHAILCLVTEELDEPLERHDPDCFVCYGGSRNKDAPENLHELLSWPGNHSRTPLHLAFLHLKNLSEETLDLFLACGQKLELQSKLLTTNVNAVDSNGNSILLYAIICKSSLELIRLLVKYGADLSARNNNGRNATLLCACQFLLDHLKYFLELGCDVNVIDTDGDNELQCMIYVCSTDSSSVTAIVEFIKVLIDAGVDKINKNKNEETAYDIAVEKGLPSEVLELLQ